MFARIVATSATGTDFLNEAETRAEHIDPALKAAGWGVVEGSKILREYPITQGRLEGHGKRAAKMIADYILMYRNHKLAVVEAKAVDKELTEGVGQGADRGCGAGQGLRRQAGDVYKRQGHLDARLPPFSLPELSSISLSLIHI